MGTANNEFCIVRNNEQTRLDVDDGREGRRNDISTSNHMTNEQGQMCTNSFRSTYRSVCSVGSRSNVKKLLSDLS
jgi:hypothetical protein